MGVRSGEGLVFSFSTPRAGSTLLAAMLGSHSEVLCPPEPWFMLSLLGLRDDRVIAAAAHDHDLARRASLDFLDEPTFYDASRAFATTVYTSMLQRAGKRLFVDHNGRYYHIAGQLRRLFPEALHIWLQRNPLDVVASYKTTWGVTPEHLFCGVITPNSFDVTAAFTTLVAHANGPERTHILKYEDLVTHPEPVVRALCGALSIPFEDQMLRFAENSDLMRSYAHSTFGDKKIHQESSIHRRSIGAWKTVLSPDEVRLTLGTLGAFPFVRLGYDDVLDEALHYARIDRSGLTECGRLAVYDEALRAYPASAAKAAVADPEQWRAVAGESASLVMEQGFRQALDEKEAQLQVLALEADVRLTQLEAIAQEAEALEAQLQAADAGRAAAHEALLQAQAATNEKEVQLQAVAQEAESRLAQLAMADAARSAAQVAVNMKEAQLQAQMAESAARLAMLQRSDAERMALQRALNEREALVQSLSQEAQLRLELLEASDAERARLQAAIDARV